MQIERKRLVALGLLTFILLSTAYTYSVSLFAFIAPSEDEPLQVNWVKSLDEYASESSIFSAGQAVTLKAKVKMGTGYYTNEYGGYSYGDYSYSSFSGNTDYTLIFTVMDEYNNPIYFGTITDTISAGEIQYQSIDFTLPEEALSGEYTVKTYAWSDWLPSGNYLASEEATASFNVGVV